MADLLWYNRILMTNSGRVIASNISLGESFEFFPEVVIQAIFQLAPRESDTRAAVLAGT